MAASTNLRLARVSPRQRDLLENAPEPVTDPDAQAYAVWRKRMLWLVVAATILQVICLGFNTTLTLGLDPLTIQVNSDGAPPETIEGPAKLKVHGAWLVRGIALVLLIILLGLISGVLAFVLVLWAAWKWYKVRRSRRLARWAWFSWFFTPLALFLVPSAQFQDPNDPMGWIGTAEQLQAIVTFFLSSLFALLPAILGSARLLKMLLPESQLPGRLAVLTAPFGSVVYLLTLSLVLQVTQNPYLVGGLALLAAAPWAHVFWGSALVKAGTREEARRTVRRVYWVDMILTVAGLALLAFYFQASPVVGWLLGKLNLAWFLAFLGGSLANRTLLNVVLCDYVLMVLYRNQESLKALAGTPMGVELEGKISALGVALRGTRKPG